VRNLGPALSPLLVITLFFATPAAAAEGGELPRIVNFAVVAAVLVLALRKPLAGYLSARTEQIKEQLKEAKSKQERADEEQTKAESLLARLDQEVQKARDEARRAAEAERDRIVKAAEIEAARIREIASKEIDAEVEAGRRKLMARATELSVELAEKKLKSAMNEADQSRLIDRSIELLGRES
jgi:F-type H+-transporting ATPase subunit b